MRSVWHAIFDWRSMMLAAGARDLNVQEGADVYLLGSY